MTSNEDFHFDWRTIRDVILIFVVAYLFLALFESCGTHKTTENTTNKELVDKAHIEQINTWYDVSRIDTFIRDRIITIVLNEKGDTVKEKESVRIREKNETNTSNKVLNEKKDSANHHIVHNHEKEEIKNEFSAWEKFQIFTYPYLLGILIVCCLVFILYVKCRNRK